VDIATRKSIDSFTLSEGNRKVRALSFTVDPQHRIMTLMTRTTTKLMDRFEIGAPTFIQYDLKDHKVVRTLPWATSADEPGYFSLLLRYSADGKLLYVFSSEILVLDAASLQQVATWDLSLTNEPSLGRFDMGSLDDSNDDPAWFSALFTMKDPVQNRPLVVVGRVNLDQKRLDYFARSRAATGTIELCAERRWAARLRPAAVDRPQRTVDHRPPREAAPERGRVPGASAHGDQDEFERQADLSPPGGQHHRSLRSRWLQVPPYDHARR